MIVVSRGEFAMYSVNTKFKQTIIAYVFASIVYNTTK